MFEVDDTNRRVNKYTPCPKSPFMPNMSIVRRCSICARSCTAHLGFHGPLKRTFTKVCKNHQVTRPVPKTQTNSRLARRAVSIVITLWRAPDQGRVGGDVGDSGSPHAQGKTPSSNGMLRSLGEDLDPGPGQRWTLRRPGPHLDQNVLGQLRGSSPGPDSEPLGRPLFPPPAWPDQRPLPNLAKRGTRKPRLETHTENEASSALLARLW